MWTEIAVNVSGVAVIIYVVLAGIEVSLDLIQKDGHYKLKDSLCSMTMGGFYLGTKLLMKSLTLVVLLLAAQYSVFDFGGQWWLFPVAYVVSDCCFYWLHRFIHEVRIAWAAHVNHHSSQEYNLAGTALRQSFAEPIMEPFFYAPMVLLGFDPLMTLAAIEVNLIYMYWLHTRKIGKLHPLFEFWFSTPSHHRVHHACNVQYLDKNYGGTLIIFDRLFGSFKEEQETVEFGIPEQINTFNPIKVSFHGWLALGLDITRTPGLLNKIRLLFMPPGWSPDGQSLTTKQKQLAYHLEKQALSYADKQPSASL